MKYTINPLKFYTPRPGYDGPSLVANEILPDGKYTIVPLAIWLDDAALMDFVATASVTASAVY